MDVFTDTALSGNPLAVVFDAEGLDTQAMQAIAAEFNLSETVFVLPPERPAHMAKLRIFTPGRELPFAGHPTVGTTILLARQSWGSEGEHEGIVVVEEEAGSIRARIERRGFDKAFPDGQVYIYCRETMSNENDFHARMFAPGMGLHEDPATGAAAAGFAGVVMRFDDPTAGHHRYRIEQGHMMGRPSIIELELEVEGDTLHTVRIGGSAVIVAEGKLFL